MGMEVPMVEEEEEATERTEDSSGLMALAWRPSILLVGPPAVGKRSLLNRLVKREIPVQATSGSGATCHGWTIDTKYYTADVCIWMARFDDPAFEDPAYFQAKYGRSEALVMLFDLSNLDTFREVQQWAEGAELQNFEILLCVGNKADHVPDHFAHTEYRRKLRKAGESSSDPHPEFSEFGIDRSEGSSLLGRNIDSSGDGEPDSPDNQRIDSPEDGRRSRIEWCSERGIEYIEACAINEIFDQCMSVDGDSQGVSRIFGALSAHMWPGLTLKDVRQRQETTPSQLDGEGMTSDDDSDYYIEYELLSNGSADPWDGPGWEDQWTQAPPPQDISSLNSTNSTPSNVESDIQQVYPASTPSESTQDPSAVESLSPPEDTQDGRHSLNATVDHLNAGEDNEEHDIIHSMGLDGREVENFNEIEQLMQEMASMRENMRSISDHQRREMAAQLAMRMASMFKDDGNDSDSE